MSIRLPRSWASRVAIDLAQLHRYLEHTVDDLLFAARHQVEHQIGEILPILEGKPPHLTEIDETNHVVRQDEDIARMRDRRGKKPWTKICSITRLAPRSAIRGRS